MGIDLYALAKELVFDGWVVTLGRDDGEDTLEVSRNEGHVHQILIYIDAGWGHVHVTSDGENGIPYELWSAISRAVSPAPAGELRERIAEIIFGHMLHEDGHVDTWADCLFVSDRCPRRYREAADAVLAVLTGGGSGDENRYLSVLWR